jgi:TRAP-type transport system small permease protein
MSDDLPAHAEPAWLRRLGTAIDGAVVAFGSGIVLLMVANVAGRALLNADISANVELGEFMLVWATFLGGAAAARRGAHMRITEIVMALPPVPQRVLEVAMRVLVLAILGGLAWNGSIIAAVNMDQTTTVLYWPVGLSYAAMPVGSALAAIFVAHETLRIAKGGTAPDIGAPDIGEG